MSVPQDQTSPCGASPLLRDGFVAPWCCLTESQRQVAKNAIKFLQGLAENASHGGRTSRRPADAYLTRVEPARHNAVALIDGKRGAGKTTLLVSILDFLRQCVERSSSSDTATWCSLCTREDHKNSRLATPKFDIQSHTLVPLRMIDLRPFPTGRPLILQLPGVLERVVAGLEQRHWHPRPGARCSLSSPPPSPEAKRLDSRMKWDNLLRSASLGWADAMAARSPSLELRQMIAEFEESERSRLEFRSAFDEFVTALVADYKETLKCPSYPLFIIPVDDADMNPERCPELLDLVRFLWHPNVAYVLTGDSELFRVAVKSQVYRSLQIQPSGPAWLSTRAAQQAHEVGLSIFDKVVPRRQRYPLPPLSLEDRYAHIKHELHSTLQELFVGAHRDHFLAALPDTMRSLQQLEHYLCRERALPDQALTATQCAHAIWKHAIDSEDAPPELSDVLPAAVTRTAAGPGQPDGLFVDVTQIRPRLLCSAFRPEGVHDLGFRVRFALELPRSEPSPFLLFSTAEHEIQDPPTSERLIAAFLLCLELQHTADTETPTAPGRRGDWISLYSRPTFVSTRIKLVPRAFPSLATLPWPTPPFCTVSEFLALNEHWTSVVTMLSTRKLDVLTAYLNAVLRTLQNSPVDAAPQPEVAALVKGLHEHSETLRNTRPQLFSWLQEELKLLSAPEFQIGEANAKALAKALGQPTKNARIQYVFRSTPLDLNTSRAFIANFSSPPQTNSGTRDQDSGSKGDAQ